MSDPGPLLALRAGLIGRFAADAALAALLGGRVRLYDEPPRGTLPVYACSATPRSRTIPSTAPSATGTATRSW